MRNRWADEGVSAPILTVHVSGEHCTVDGTADCSVSLLLIVRFLYSFTLVFRLGWFFRASYDVQIYDHSPISNMLVRAHIASVLLFISMFAPYLNLLSARKTPCALRGDQVWKEAWLNVNSLFQRFI
ncbi:hypothetical protein DFH29DRAFT_609444 [Suillus ampliporus]|nr:hypothetical protein DFH29DRAFT_609444 [Suillus ampliporus]